MRKKDYVHDEYIQVIRSSIALRYKRCTVNSVVSVDIGWPCDNDLFNK